jgi:DNA polymerase-3 subunit delta'
VKRVGRRARTRALGLGLALCCTWFRDLGVVASGAPEVALNSDRLDRLEADAAGLDPTSAREAVELILETRRRLVVNVSEELALEALWLRLGEVLQPA